MKRMVPLVVAGLLVLLVGCQVSEERKQLPALPENAPAQPYIELVLRARDHATKANEAFYINNWTAVEGNARSLEQLTKFLLDALDTPPKVKDRVKDLASDLRKASIRLRDAALSKDEDATTKAMAEVNRKVRELRPED